MKTVYLENNVVREIIPDYALPVSKFYGDEFAAHCMEAPDEVAQGLVYADGEWSTIHGNGKTLEENKLARIQQTRDDLDAYLLSHPLLWNDGEYYSITKEKQNKLTSKIMVATMAQTMRLQYELKWNSTGEKCTVWTLSDLSALAFAIDKRVTALVEYQQAKEIEIKEAHTQEELDAIEVDYDTVQ